MRSLARLAYLIKPYTRWVTIGFILLIGAVVVDLLIPRLLQTIVDEGIANRDVPTIVRTMATMLGLAALSAALGVGNMIFAVRASQHFGADLRETLYTKVQSLSFGNLDHLETGQLLVRLTSDVQAVQMLALMALRILVRAPLLLVGSILFMLLTSWRLALVMVVVAPLVAIIVVYFSTKARVLFTEFQRRLDRVNTVLQENLAGVRVVKAFVRATHEEERFGAANVNLTSQAVYVIRIMSFVMPSLMFLLNAALVAVLWFGGLQVSVGNLTVGEVFAFINYLMIANFPLIFLGMMINQVSAADASAARILEVLDTVPEICEPEHPRSIDEVQGRVAFENVSFRYNSGDSDPVLKNISLTVDPGEKVAILGATGSGKSSLVNLIPRYYEVTEGRVTLDGIDVRELPLQTLRSQVSVALQEAVLFTGTVRDNIRYGRPEATAEEVVEVAKAAQIHEHIVSLPEGYDTQIGQRGVNLSGGQKQRLSIARALLMRPAVLVLDDSTSAVDVETEGRIQEALEQLGVGRTRIVIAQRISTVLHADKIVVLDQGEVSAIGTHNELMGSSPIYREIFDSQLGDGVKAYVS